VVFGTVKQLLQAAMGHDASCGDKVAHLMKLLQRSTDAIINEIPLRLDVCVNARGNHVVEELKQLGTGRELKQRSTVRSAIDLSVRVLSRFISTIRVSMFLSILARQICV
jgi:hypothetical protein